MKSLGILKPTGQLLSVQTFFTNRRDAVRYLISNGIAGIDGSRRSIRDGSSLGWKRLKRLGWKIVPVEHSVAS